LCASSTYTSPSVHLSSQPKEPFVVASTPSLHPSKKQQYLRKIHPNKRVVPRNPRATRSMSLVKESLASIDGTITNLTSATDSMISYRPQRHLWETSDGGLHVLINQGGSTSTNGLALFSSFDQGQTWTLSLTLINTGIPANGIVLPSADGLLKNNKLLLAFATATGTIKYLIASYDAGAQQWSTAFSNVIASNPQTFVASNPTLAADANGIFWCAFVSVNISTRLYTIQLYRSNNQGQNWSDTGVTFGMVSPSKARSARLVALPNRLGMVYTIDKDFYWAYRLNSDAPNTDWQKQLIFQSSGEDKDPYGSHFSVVSDLNFNLHLTTASNKKLVYLRYRGQNQAWDSPTVLNQFVGVAYTQAISAPDGKVFIALNVGTSGINVLQSEDSGTTFSNAYFLKQPDISLMGGVANFDYPRMIAPSSLLSKRLPILRQFVLDDVQRLSYYGINIAP
jgi:hypothetical protein